MSARASSTAIGVFVSGAILLAVVAVLIFGSGKLFSKQEKFIIYFDDSVNGLTVGSPVKFKGVQIGQVSNIMIHYDQADDSASIPVIVDIDVSRLHNELGDDVDLSDAQVFAAQVSGGLRAKLQLQSLLTGLLYIDLDYYDDLANTPPPPPNQLVLKKYKEIPSLPSGLSEMMKSVTTALENISEIDFKSISMKVNNLLDQLNNGVSQIQFKEINDQLLAATTNLNAILADPQLKQAIAQLNTTLGSFQQLSDNVNAQVQPLSSQIQLTAQRARATMDQVDKTLLAVRELVQPQSSLRYQLDSALSEIAGASQAIRVLADYLERNPGALLTGRPPPEPLPVPGKEAEPVTTTTTSSPPEAPAAAPVSAAATEPAASATK
jgi:paraquat-inducible protein B